MLPEITRDDLSNAKSAKNSNIRRAGERCGRDPVFLAAACYRQASLSHEQAIKLLDALGLDQVFRG